MDDEKEEQKEAMEYKYRSQGDQGKEEKARGPKRRPKIS